MNKDEMSIVEEYKVQELRKVLSPIKNWDSVKRQERLFYGLTDNIFKKNYFIRYNSENNLTTYSTKSESGCYVDCKLLGDEWYHYNEIAVDNVERHYTPKLYVVTEVKSKNNYWLIVAFDGNHLKKVFLEEKNLGKMTDSDFSYKYSCKIISNVNGFKVMLK